jgi:putative oxidoreductase
MPGIAGPFIGTLELVGGILLLLGLFGRWLGLLYAIEFVVATFYVKFAGTGWASGRLDLMLLAGGILIFLAGPGKAAIDAVWLEKGRLVEKHA